MEKKYYFCTVKTATKYKIFGSPRWDGDCSGPFRCTFFAKNHNGQSPKPLFPKERSTFSYHYTFTGKELDSETGYSYFGARYYDAELSGLFFSVDPMADKYPNISPYDYCAWNPVKLVDPDGEKPRLYFHGAKSRETFVSIVNNGLGGQFCANLKRNPNGSYTFSIVATQGGGDVGKLTERQLAFYNALSKCIDAKTRDGQELKYDIDVFYGSESIVVGSYQDNAIDVADMNQFNDLHRGGATKQGKLIHELVEQCKKAYFGNEKGDMMGYNKCHGAACLEEGKVNGNRREKMRDKKTGRHVMQETFIQDGKELHVKISTNTPIIGVSQ